LVLLAVVVAGTTLGIICADEGFRSPNGSKYVDPAG
jgi:hypothetical protein